MKKIYKIVLRFVSVLAISLPSALIGAGVLSLKQPYVAPAKISRRVESTRYQDMIKKELIKTAREKIQNDRRFSVVGLAKGLFGGRNAEELRTAALDLFIKRLEELDERGELTAGMVKFPSDPKKRKDFSSGEYTFGIYAEESVLATVQVDENNNPTGVIVNEHNTWLVRFMDEAARILL